MREEREGSPSQGGGGRSRRIETGRLSPRRVRERPRCEEVLDREKGRLSPQRVRERPHREEVLDLEEEGYEGLRYEDDLRWELTRNRYRDRRQPREARRITGERRKDQEDVLAKTIRTMKRQLEDLREGNFFKKSDWKNRSNRYQFCHNKGVLKLLRRVKEAF